MLGRRTPIIVLCLLAVATSGAAQDQEWVSRGFIVVNGGYQATTTDFRDTVRFTTNVEEGRLETGYAVDAGPQFDVSGGVRISRNFGVGLGVSRFAKSGVSDSTAFLPHPFYFNRLRVADGAASTDREELVVHVQALLFVPVTRRVEIVLFGGPSLFRVRQGLVSDVAYTEAYPYNTATFQRAVIQTSDGSRLGFNVGADVTVFFSRHVGAGGLVRLSRASVGLVSVDDDALRVDAGGLHFGAGLRLRF